MENQEMDRNNMISNLPLLFANGYPTSLDKITERQLESFIPFMVQCSLGHINLQDKIEYSEPEWWPDTIQFAIPFIKPREFIGNWMDKMKEIVIVCYQFHKSVFLLRFCNDLASYEHASLRFINNYNSTTSLFDRRSNKLLVTFRNENMSYDKLQINRKCLFQHKVKNGQTDNSENPMMVEPAPFDIYLCDNCDAELYSKEATLEHEKICNVDDNDVILCDSPEPTGGNHLLHFFKDSEYNELRIGFLLNFNLHFRENVQNPILINATGPFQKINYDFRGTMSPKENWKILEKNYDTLDSSGRVPRRNRTVHSLARCPTIPLSSPAGQVLVRTTKACITQDYLDERLDRIERFCQARTIISSDKPKYVDRKYTNNIHCTFKKPQEYSTHIYVFPRRQYSQKRRKESFMFFNSPLIKKCRPISVRLKKISEKELKRKILKNSKLNIKLTRDNSRRSSWKISSSPSKEIIVDTIDLCSSDDDFDKPGKKFTEPFVQTYCRKQSINAITPLTSYEKTIDKPFVKSKGSRPIASEVRLTPIIKYVSHCPIKYETKCTRSLSLNSHNATSQQVPDNIKNQLFEANIRFTSPTVATGSRLTQPKALQPSVFIFTNYVTKPMSLISDDNKERIFNSNIDLLETDNFKTQNQENNSTQTAVSTNGKSTVEWFSPNNLETFSSNFTHACVIDRRTGNLPLVPTFSSPPRIISIDLTS